MEEEPGREGAEEDSVSKYTYRREDYTFRDADYCVIIESVGIETADAPVALHSPPFVFFFLLLIIICIILFILLLLLQLLLGGR